MISIREAATATNKAKPTILKAIKTGRLPATKNAKGEWRIDPTELFRVYSNESSKSATHKIKMVGVDLQAEIERLKAEVTKATQDTKRWQEQADKWQQQTEKVTLLLVQTVGYNRF